MPKITSKYNLLFSYVVLFCSFLHRYNTCSPIILIGLIDSFTDYWSKTNVTESVERYRSMSATYWSRWLLLVCTSKYLYKLNRNWKPSRNVFFLLTLSLNKFHQNRRKFFFFFLHFSFVFFIQIYIYYSTKFFSLLHLFFNISTKN